MAQPVNVSQDMDQLPAAVRSQADQTSFVRPTDDQVASDSQQQTSGATGRALAYVKAGDTSTVNIPDPKSIRSDSLDARGVNGEAATVGHETTHVLENNRPPTEQAPPDDPSKPYDISDIADMRTAGKTFKDLPQEKAATVVQKYIESGGKDASLKPWIQDIKNLPQSTIMPTGKTSAALNTTARAPKGGQAQLEELQESDVHNPPPKAVAKSGKSWYTGASALKGK